VRLCIVVVNPLALKTKWLTLKSWKSSMMVIVITEFKDQTHFGMDALWYHVCLPFLKWKVICGIMFVYHFLSGRSSLLSHNVVFYYLNTFTLCLSICFVPRHRLMHMFIGYYKCVYRVKK
jgi:hypothetical protein